MIVIENRSGGIFIVIVSGGEETWLLLEVQESGDVFVVVSAGTDLETWLWLSLLVKERSGNCCCHCSCC